MSKKHPSQDELLVKLQMPGPTLNTQPVNSLGAPMVELGIQVTLDKLRAYDRNPRKLRNPKYDEIKESIRAVGLKNPPVITQRPGDDKYMISDGGNTRLQILQELYEETGDKRFYEFYCIYRPWISEAAALAGHLSENETRGDLTWIEKSLGVQALKEQLEAEAGETLPQRELARRAKVLGFALDQSHISRMLHTVEHIWPTLPMTLESGMGQPQIKQLIAYREASLLIWQRCDAKPEDDFGPAWHETLAYFDHEGQTVLPWSLVEDRLLGMLSDETGAHLSPIEHALQTILEYRKRRWSLEEHAEQVWGPLDAEMERLRNPDAPPLDYQPASLTKNSQGGKASSLSNGAGDPLSLVQGKTGEPAYAKEAPGLLPTSRESMETNAGSNRQDSKQEALRREQAVLWRELERLQEESALLQRAPIASTSHTESDSDLDLDGLMPPASDENLEEQWTEEARQQRLDALTVTPHREADSHRRMREMMAREHGGEPIDFENNALRSIPLMAGGPMHPVTDIWAIEAHFQGTRELRLEISLFAQYLGRWAGINMPGDQYKPIIPTHEAGEGLGYTLEPLNEEQAQNRRAQWVWQFLAGLIGEPLHPMYPTDVGLIGELLGTVSDDEGMPDEILVRVFRMVRLMRVLKEQLREGSAS
ncbi:ParB family protein [Billgrantia ethanolica]|uniref:ParB N-terminal domain-containing protein n=1 Tax=Billgrantia ethanolica TaxID=2733486 RepID=A0ABS9A932_9GAMM|nr:ParB family protein [Halomonas ethanolica]MCE8005322.1 ParB N-terminal domain-containing protein [Halomonas ethanolica]